MLDRRLFGGNDRESTVHKMVIRVLRKSRDVRSRWRVLCSDARSIISPRLLDHLDDVVLACVTREHRDSL